MTKRHNYDLGVIGNCAFLANINKQAELVWLCWPRFDSPSVFGKLIANDNGGSFSIVAKSEQVETKQYYLENTNVLCTDFVTKEGSFRVTDFAPRFRQYERNYKPLMLMRKIEKLSGNPKIAVHCSPRGGYGTLVPETSFGSNHIRYRGMEDQLRLTTGIPLSYIASEKTFILTRTEYLALSWGVPLEAPLELTAEDFLKKTTAYWRGWVETLTIPFLYQEDVIRSSLVLKLHQYEDTGAVIAASTTSLPEHPGSGRNWDYRYCWVRDTYYTLSVLNLIGHFSELEKYSHFIQNIALMGNSLLQPVYSIDGSSTLEEKELPLSGYLGNTPVRIGNDAYKQTQNDVYGQVLVSLLPLYIDKRFTSKHRMGTKDLVERLLGDIERTMDAPDAGIWELRTSEQKHCYTFLFHWAGSSAAAKIAECLGDEKMLKKATSLRNAASENIEDCFDPDQKAYTQSKKSSFLDASLLQLITLNYLKPDSPRAKDHLRAIEKELAIGDGLFYRYKHSDDFGKPKAAFLVCSFWYAEALACVGRLDEARKTFETLLGYMNHLRLLSEDIDPQTKSQWGNFPQTYSHVGLVKAAFRIANKLDQPQFL